MSKLFVSCDEANHVCDKNQYKEASLWEKVKLNIHLIYCGACRKYSSRNGKLTKLFKSDKVEVMHNAEREKLQSAFEQELAKHHNQG
ncbi:hypothetical protein Q2T40_06415 [Winogradskyella maritima]|uniref:Glycine dehydrogenase n=1 Tax=Winogradskyella maritima TaxID=1517766 RepID=A0ABV8ALA4_9FLAO|nr:hypothetical protein [Winogradskyella maritima]